jgi:hypothetical protein
MKLVATSKTSYLAFIIMADNAVFVNTPYFSGGNDTVEQHLRICGRNITLGWRVWIKELPLRRRLEKCMRFLNMPEK